MAVRNCAKCARRPFPNASRRVVEWKSEENPEKQFAALAKRIGINSDRLIQALQKPELRERVTKDIAIGQAANIQAVPTFFINGERVSEPPQTEEAFAALIDAQLGKKK